jgi:methyl-accepting chemotaxis protein
VPKPGWAADVDVEIDAISAQVTQARSILGDAVNRLSRSFTTLDTESRGQRAAIDALLGVLTNESTLQAQDRVSAGAFAKETGAVLTQFTDLLAQVSKQSVRTVYRIDDMTEELGVIFKLVASIDDIAEETSILAVNATIEAAHAGNAGRSFSIIAGHIRELSKRTRRFNEEIADQVGKARRTVSEVRTIIAEMASRDLNLALSGKERVQAMLGGLEHFQHFVAETLGRTNESAGRIGTATNEAVMGLQFEDILNQLLGTLEKHALSIRAVIDGDGDGDGQPGAGSEGRAAERPPKRPNPVQQESMSAGDVELF